MKAKDGTMESVVSLCKRRGFIYQGSEIYGGLAGTWDYGPLGLSLKKNIENLWWKTFVSGREDMYGIDSAILMNPKVWQASGHIDGFHDPLIEDTKTHKRYRADHLLEDAGVDVTGMTLEDMTKAIQEKGILSPDGNPLGDAQQFNMMFKTSIGASSDSDSQVFLRPETAQGMFVNFKNILDTFHPKLPFGIAQIGRSFRNEIAPRDFIFRVRELEIMEFEYFVREADWEEQFEYWRKGMLDWFEAMGLPRAKVHELEVPEEDRAHYSKRTVDFEFEYPFGVKEIGGLAYRTDFDLKQHMELSGVDLRYFDQGSGERFLPHVLEPTFGLGRLTLAAITEAYTEDEMDRESRVVLKFPYHLAPYKVAVFPLLKNKPHLVEKAHEVFKMVKQEIPETMFDDNGNIGKRYRRQDEIGTPYCVTIDFETLEGNEGPKDTVTVRDRDTGEQRRVAIADLLNELKQ